MVGDCGAVVHNNCVVSDALVAFADYLIDEELPGHDYDIGTGIYSVVAGHHPMSGAAFGGRDAATTVNNDDYKYHYNKDFAVSPNRLLEVWKANPENAGKPEPVDGNMIHSNITKKQAELYRAFGKDNDDIDIKQIVEIEKEAMIKAGIPSHYASGWLRKSLKDLKENHKISKIIKIPYKKS